MAKPVLKVDHWPISVAVWENEHEGRKFFSATLSRCYKDKQSGAYKNSDSINASDLLVAAECLREAWVLVGKLEAAGRPTRKWEPASERQGGPAPVNGGTSADADTPF